MYYFIHFSFLHVTIHPGNHSIIVYRNILPLFLHLITLHCVDVPEFIQPVRY